MFNSLPKGVEVIKIEVGENETFQQAIERGMKLVEERVSELKTENVSAEHVATTVDGQPTNELPGFLREILEHAGVMSVEQPEETVGFIAPEAEQAEEQTASAEADVEVTVEGLDFSDKALEDFELWYQGMKNAIKVLIRQAKDLGASDETIEFLKGRKRELKIYRRKRNTLAQVYRSITGEVCTCGEEH